MIRFGTGGWRAIIADGFTKENLRLLAAGVCRLLEKEGLSGAKIAVGYDRRFLAKESAHWIAEVLAGNGFQVMMVDRSSPTPLLMYAVKTEKLPCGLMVTASHNPAVYNGVKVFIAGGRDAERAVTDRIEAEITQVIPEEIRSMDYDKAVKHGIVQEENPTNEYIDSILDLIDTKAIRNARLKIALDPMYGVSQTSLRTILATCRCDLEVIHDRHDTLFGGKLPAPNAATLSTLAYVVKDANCNFGIATDGDADRLGVIDEKGNFVHPNHLLVLLYYYLVKTRGWKGPCVRNNSTTHLLDRVAQGLGQRCYEVPVGFKYVSAKMTETDAVIGGESSGGLSVRGHISGKDGIYAGALLAEMVAVTGKSITELYREITDRYGVLIYRETDHRMTPEHKAALQDRLFLREEMPAFDRIERVDRTDGVKIWFSDESWVICRFSGTEPLLRMASEAENAEQAECYLKIWRDYLEL
ncbi:MAG: phosphoglucomutase/phosphomannomutase family protein [Oscillospiraceae bacterium]|nr:phosphoglucomutase/phosphomannomutase family protein [Oscillospiraceae bacterium]MBR0391344.1 phosphoglucomutase/phosphomannomutase family protein [Oscillospiraceae bacterium]